MLSYISSSYLIWQCEVSLSFICMKGKEKVLGWESDAVNENAAGKLLWVGTQTDGRAATAVQRRPSTRCEQAMNKRQQQKYF